MAMFDLGIKQTDNQFNIQESLSEYILDKNNLLANIQLANKNYNNYLQVLGYDKFDSWSGKGEYWTNLTYSGTLFNNPIVRLEKAKSQEGRLYLHEINELPNQYENKEYTLVAMFKSSNSTKTREPIDTVYQGGGQNPNANNVIPYEDKLYKQYIGNGWWRYIYIFKIDRHHLPEEYRSQLYLGFKWLWNNAGQYMFATQPQLFIGVSSQLFPVATQTNNIMMFNKQAVVEEPIVNQISISNMQNYKVGYSGNVCGFNNNFEEAFGTGNYKTIIVKQLDIPVEGLNKSQRIETFQRDSTKPNIGGWISNNIGNTTGSITYGVLIKLYRGEIRFGDLNSKNSFLTINEDYYKQRGYKLGEWIWQVGTFEATDGGRHLYQVGNTKAEIQQVQIYNSDKTLTYVNGSSEVGYIEIPVDIFNEFKDEFSVSFIYEPTQLNVYGNTSQLFTLNWQDLNTQSENWRNEDFVGIYRTNSYREQDSLIFGIVDGTNKVSNIIQVTGLKERLYHKLFVLASISTKEKEISLYIKDLTTNETITKRTVKFNFQFNLGFKFQRIGNIFPGQDQQNQQFSNFNIYSKYIKAEDGHAYVPKNIIINDNTKQQGMENIIEQPSVLDNYGYSQFENGKLSGIWQAQTSPNSNVQIIPRGHRTTRYSYFLQRTKSASNNKCGVKISMLEPVELEENKMYILRFFYRGNSNSQIRIYFQHDIENPDFGVGLKHLELQAITDNINELDGWRYYEAKFLVPEGYIYQTGNDGNIYNCIKELKIGYDDNEITQDEWLMITDVQIIPTADERLDTLMFMSNSIVSLNNIKEGSQFVNIFILGTSNNQPGKRMLKINDNTIYNEDGTINGLRLTVFDNNFNVMFDQEFGNNDTELNNLAQKLKELTTDKYWQLTSYGTVNSNNELTKQMRHMNSRIWPLYEQSTYQQFGQGQYILYEDGAPHDQNYLSRQIINLFV